MWKFKVFSDFTKEEEWLCGMAEKGWMLKNVQLGYSFAAAPAQKALIKIDYRDSMKQDAFLDYIALFEDSGWKHICGSRWGGAQYFCRMQPKAGKDIFSDDASRRGRYKRRAAVYTSLLSCYVALFVIFGNQTNFGWQAVLHPKSLYFTPGLWDLSGLAFWGRFLFETPFAILRALPTVFIPIALVLLAWFAYKTYRLSKK